MKNIFGLNKTYYDDGVAEEFDGSRFISATLSEGEPEAVSAPSKETPPLPALLSILQYVFVALFAIALGIWVSSGKTIALLWQTSPYLLLMMIVGFVGFSVIATIDAVRTKKFAKENGIDSISELEQYADLHEVDEEAEAEEAARVKAELGIPEKALDMDFLSFFYRDGEDGPVAFKPFDFMTMEMFSYADAECLHVADFNCVYSIPKSFITKVEKIDSPAKLLGWSKNESFDSDVYASYGMTETEEGFILIPYYYSAEIKTDDGEEFSLLFPPYEADAFEKLLSSK